jgi:hypothetical protein
MPIKMAPFLHSGVCGTLRLTSNALGGADVTTRKKLRRVNMRLKELIRTMAFAVTAIAAGSVNAAIITQWDVGVDASFIPATIIDSNGNTPGGVTVSNSNKTLRWGTSTGSGQSGLDILNSPVNTTVNTGIDPVVLPPVPDVALKHTNQPITGTSLDKVTLSVALTLTPLIPPLGALAPTTTTFLIDFLETPNGANPCANGEPNNTGVNSNGCGDIFVIGSNALNYSFSYDTDGAGGDDPQEYFLSFVEATSGLHSLSPAACLAATGSSAPCLGFITPEQANTTFQFGALITTKPVVIIPDQPDVPEPDVLLLMGLGLAGLGGMRRGRKA